MQQYLSNESVTWLCDLGHRRLGFSYMVGGEVRGIPDEGRVSQRGSTGAQQGFTFPG